MKSAAKTGKNRTTKKKLKLKISFAVVKMSLNGTNFWFNFQVKLEAVRWFAWNLFQLNVKENVHFGAQE